MQIIAALIIIGSGVWVYYDARSTGMRRGLIKGFFDMDPIEWALCVAGFWIFVFPQYLYMRRQYEELLGSPSQGATDSQGEGKTENTPNDLEYFGRTWQQVSIGWAGFCFFLYVLWFFLLGNELSQIKVIGGKFSELLGEFIGGVCWFGLLLIATAPAVTTYLIARRFGQTVVVVQKPEKLSGQTKHCPYCAEIIGANAIYCRYCAKDLAPASQPSGKEASRIKPLAGKVEGKAAPAIGETKKDWLKEGQQLLKAGNAQAALAALTEAIKEDGSQGLAYYTRAVAYSKTGDGPKALADLKKAAELGYEPAISYLQKQKK